MEDAGQILFAARPQVIDFARANGPTARGECAPGYIPTDEDFREGYREEHGYCWVAPRAEQIIAEALKKALAK